jgi:pyridoxamine-phosphate oxidase
MSGRDGLVASCSAGRRGLYPEDGSEEEEEREDEEAMGGVEQQVASTSKAVFVSGSWIVVWVSSVLCSCVIHGGGTREKGWRFPAMAALSLRHLSPHRLVVHRHLRGRQQRGFMNIDIPEKIKITSHHQYDAPEHLTPDQVHKSPIEQFKQWFTFAANSSVPEPEAMSLATVSKDGVPSSRMVLLKEVDESGFLFFTNYSSRKSEELASNGHAALNFYWREIHRQVRVVGRVEKVDEETSTGYFHTRPIGSRIGAWASPQSQPVGEQELQERYSQFEKKFADGGGRIPRPEHWGGWRILPW